MANKAIYSVVCDEIGIECTESVKYRISSSAKRFMLVNDLMTGVVYETVAGSYTTYNYDLRGKCGVNGVFGSVSFQQIYADYLHFIFTIKDSSDSLNLWNSIYCDTSLARFQPTWLNMLKNDPTVIKYRRKIFDEYK